jgi:VanZ family protein
MGGDPTLTSTRATQRLGTWLPPLALMAAIFVLSAQSDLNSGLGTIDFIGRKIIHMGEYALLCFLWWRALRTVMRPKLVPAVAFAMAVAYAATDEFHQHFVSGRHGTPVDVCIDAVGAGIAAFLLIRRRRAA